MTLIKIKLDFFVFVFQPCVYTNFWITGCHFSYFIITFFYYYFVLCHITSHCYFRYPHWMGMYSCFLVSSHICYMINKRVPWIQDWILNCTYHTLCMFTCLVFTHRVLRWIETGDIRWTTNENWINKPWDLNGRMRGSRWTTFLA